MQNLKDKVIAITGAGSGIGRALAIQLAGQGAKLALNDWNETNLLETERLLPPSTERLLESFDVGEQSAVYQFAQNVVDHFGQVDVIVNNAGITLEQRKTSDSGIDDFEKVLRINLWGVIYGSKAFLPFFSVRPQATIVNISSIFGIAGQPLQGPYVTSKFGVRGFSETLRNELEHTNVSVLTVHPGGIRTNIIKNIETDQQVRRDKFAKAFEKMAKTSPEDAAAVIIKAIQQKKRRLLIGRDAKSMDLLVRFFPSLYQKIIYRNFDIERFSAK